MAKEKRVIHKLVPDEGVIEFESRLKQNILHLPKEIQEASGIVINGRRIKSLLFTTDVALIHNCDADAIFAVYLANDAESQGAIGVVVNTRFPNSDLKRVAQLVDIPVVVTIVSSNKTHVGARIRHGASILNVAGGKDTPKMVAKIRADFPTIPIMASGGKTPESIRATIEAGANAIIYSPPSSSELEKLLMEQYREEMK